MASALGTLAARGARNLQAPGLQNQQLQKKHPADQANGSTSPQREAGALRLAKAYQNKKPYLSGQPQKARPVMAPPQNIKIQQKDTGNQPSPINDNDLVQDDDGTGRAGMLGAAVDQLADTPELSKYASTDQ